MPLYYTCAQGHQWQGADDASATQDAEAVCPVCGAAAAASASDPDLTQEAIRRDARPPRVRRPPAPAWPAVPGYEIRAVLGEGGMGIVYKAWDLRLRRFVALKMIREGSRARPVHLARFRREAEALAALHHPHIVQIYEVGEHQGSPYFALEYIEGGSLSRRLQSSVLPPRDAAALVATLAGAVHAAHQRGIVHRDLKPANVLLQTTEYTEYTEQSKDKDKDTKEGREKERKQGDVGAAVVDGSSASSSVYSVVPLFPKITDFGLAKRLDEEEGQTRPGTILGTPYYMAPEQAEGRTHEQGPAVDIYALGAILYHLLTGRPPFVGETDLDTLQQVRIDDPVPPTRLQPKVPRDLETICLKCLEKDPARRYSAAANLADDLHRFLAGEPTLARPVGLLGRGLKWARRRPAAAGLVAVSALATVGLLGVSLWYTAQLRAERDRAELHFRLARQAVADMLAEVEQERLAYEPSLEKQRNSILAKAQAYYTRFLEEKSPDPRLSAELGQAQKQLGDISRRLGDYVRARQAYEQAAALFTALAADRPDDPAPRNTLGDCHTSLGEVHRLAGRPEEARLAYEEAQRLFESLAVAQPGRPEYRLELARCRYNLGILFKETRRLEDAERSYRDALELLHGLVEQDPDTPAYRQHLARVYLNLGPVLRQLDRPEEAEDVYREAIRLQDSLVALHPSVADYRHELAVTCNNLGYLLQSRGRYTEAEAAFRQALDLFANLAGRLPSVPTYRLEQANTSNNLAIVLARQQQYGSAEEAWRQALAHYDRLASESPDIPDYGARRGIALGNLGWLFLQQKRNLPQALEYLDEGTRLVQEALRRVPNHPLYLQALGDQQRSRTQVAQLLGEPER